MGKFKRIQINDIKAMQKTLDDLPDKNLGKTREEAAEMLNAQKTTGRSGMVHAGHA